MTDLNRTVAVTGATGFIGARILDHLTEECGFAVRALTRRPQPQRANVTWVTGSLHDQKSLDQLAAGTDALIHVAGLIKAKSRRAFDEVNVEGCRRIADATAKAGTRLILISSLAAREPNISDYAASKVGGEKAIAETLQKTPWTILRPPAVYGPGDGEILKLLRAMKLGIAPAPGSGRNRFSLFHVDDLARAVSAALWRSETYGKTYEIDDGRQDGYAMAEIAALVARVFGRKVRVLPLPYPLLVAAGGLNELIATMSRQAPMLTRNKAKELTWPDWTVAGPRLSALGFWSPEIDAEKGLATTIQWYRNAGLL